MQPAPLVLVDDVRVRALSIRKQVSERDAVELHDTDQATDRDIRLALLDHRQERSRDRSALGDLGQRQVPRLTERAQNRSYASVRRRGRSLLGAARRPLPPG